jgi:hypothetical protein
MLTIENLLSTDSPLLTPETKICLSNTESLMKWAVASNNQNEFISFSDALFVSIKNVIKKKPTTTASRQMM